MGNPAWLPGPHTHPTQGNHTGIAPTIAMSNWNLTLLGAIELRIDTVVHA